MNFNELFSRALKLFPYKIDGKPDPNLQQVEIMKNILTLPINNQLIIKASTGSGKTASTLTALIARADFRHEKIIVFVRTISQMNPIIREWSRIIGGYAGLQKPNTPMIIPVKGKTKLCKIKDSIEQFGNLSPEAFGLLCKTIPCALWPGNSNHVVMLPKTKSPKYTIRKLNFKLAGAASIQGKSPVDIVDQVYHELPGCGYYLQNELMRYAKIIVLSYPYLNDEPFSRILKQAGISDIGDALILIDEAHNLTKLQETIITVEDINTVIKLVGKSALLKKLQRIANLVGVYTESQIATEYEWELTQSLLNGDKQLLDALQLSKWDLLIPEVVRIRNFISIRKQGKISVRSGEIRVVEITPAKKLAKLKEANLVVYQSGTIDIEESKLYFDINAQTLDTVPAYKENLFKCYLMARGLTSKVDKRTEKMFMKMAQTIIELHSLSPRHTLVVCASYQFKESLLEYMLPLAPDLVNETRTSTMKELTDAIRNAKSQRVILAVSGAKITEGVELVREGSSYISLVLMAGIAFRPPRDDEVLLTKEVSQVTRKQHVDAQKMKIINEIDQAFGRAVRSLSDRGMLIILDYRARRYARELNLKCYTDISMLKSKISDFFHGYQTLSEMHHSFISNTPL